LAAFEQAVGPGEALVNLAFVYQTQGKREEAKQAYRKALELQPDLDLARRALAKLEAPPKQKAGEGEEIAATEASAPQHRPRARASHAKASEEARSSPPSQAAADRNRLNREAALARLEDYVRRRQQELETAPKSPEPPIHIEVPVSRPTELPPESP
jgi:tetratricopeptide (TPR) repeat protein